MYMGRLGAVLNLGLIRSGSQRPCRDRDDEGGARNEPKPLVRSTVVGGARRGFHHADVDVGRSDRDRFEDLHIRTCLDDTLETELLLRE